MKKIKMNPDYEQVVCIVCGDDWSGPASSPDDRDGGLGIAMILAYLRGNNSRLSNFAKEIDVPAYLLETAYKRLQINGLFSPRSWVLDDPLLRLGESNYSNYGNSAISAWCYIAGMASGYTGKGFTREEFSLMYEQKDITTDET